MISRRQAAKHRRSLPRQFLRWLRVLALGWLSLSLLVMLLLRFVDPPIWSWLIQRTLDPPQDYPAQPYHSWRELEQIAPAMWLAVVAAEDQRFPQHWGIDWHAIQTSLQDAAAGKGLRGASTLTQQVAKNLFLWQGRSYLRKGLEAWFTVWLEALWSKRRILEVYLNIAEFGRGVFGIAAASETFYKKTPDRLTRSQSALLAAALPNPRQLRVDRPSPYMRTRAGWILNQMNQLNPPAF